MNDPSSNSNSRSDATTQQDPADLPNLKWLTKPSEIQFLQHGELDFEDNTEYFFTGLQAASDSRIEIRRLFSLCLFMVSHVRYKPASNSYAKSAANNGNKDGNIERIIWLIDIFGNTGYNMAAMILQRGQSDSILFGNDRSMRNSEKAGK